MSRKRGGFNWSSLNPFAAEEDPYNRNPNGSIKHKSALQTAANAATKAATKAGAEAARIKNQVRQAAERVEAQPRFLHPKGGRRHHRKSHRRISRHRQTRKQRRV